MGQAGDGFVIELAFGFVGAFHQYHPARQAGGRATVIQEGQPFAPVEGVTLAVRIVVAAQALEQPVELLQPGTGRRTVVGLGQPGEFGQGGQAHRVQGLFAAGGGALDGNEPAQLPQSQAQ
ncbi:hypothetical protein D3C80_1766010 [compost metagenome]